MGVRGKLRATVAAVAVCVMGAVVAPAGVRASPAEANAPGPVDAPFDKAALAAQADTLTDAAPVDPAASVGPHRPRGPQRSELEQLIGDAVGDVGDPRGDIVGSYAELFVEGTTDLEIRVSRYDDPFGQNWLEGETYRCVRCP